MNDFLKFLIPNADTAKGISERVLYAGFFLLAMKMVKWGVIDLSDAEYVATGGVLAFGSIRAWIINRPSALMNSAQQTLPKGTQLEIIPPVNATHEEKKEIIEVAKESNDQVTAKVL